MGSVCRAILSAMAALVRMHSAGVIFDDEFSEVMRRLEEAMEVARRVERAAMTRIRGSLSKRAP